MLEKLQAIEPIKGSNEWRFNFAEPEKMPQHLIFAQELNCGYDGKPILTNVKVKVEPQDRIGVLGVNGAGKSTLIKTRQLANGIAYRRTCGDIWRNPLRNRLKYRVLCTASARSAQRRRIPFAASYPHRTECQRTRTAKLSWGI